tara:strand:- start:4508 stop:5068 length:561 start_codon:yes stop_codon:yes gene_type:complete
MSIEVNDHKFSGVKIITPKIHADNRGIFSEIYNEKDLIKANIFYKFLQENHSISYKKNTLRGLHAQLIPYAQAKLVRCSRGSFLDVFVDIRKSSKTFMSWSSEFISAKNKKQILIPEGFLHGFLTHEDNTEVIYKCSNFYSPKNEISVIFNDDEFKIDWGIKNGEKILISEKDKMGKQFKDIDNPF